MRINTYKQVFTPQICHNHYEVGFLMPHLSQKHQIEVLGILIITISVLRRALTQWVSSLSHFIVLRIHSDRTIRIEMNGYFFVKKLSCFFAFWLDFSCTNGTVILDGDRLHDGDDFSERVNKKWSSLLFRLFSLAIGYIKWQQRTPGFQEKKRLYYERGKKKNEAWHDQRLLLLFLC